MEQIIEFIGNLLLGNGIVIAVGAYVLAEIIKKAFPGNKAIQYIPAICGAAGALVACLTPSLFEGNPFAIKAIMGLALGWAATGGYETFKSKKAA